MVLCNSDELNTSSWFHILMLPDAGRHCLQEHWAYWRWRLVDQWT